jgi:hypothetical protein
MSDNDEANGPRFLRVRLMRLVMARLAPVKKVYM